MSHEFDTEESKPAESPRKHYEFGGLTKHGQIGQVTKSGSHGKGTGDLSAPDASS